jgi:ferredoxin
LFQAEIDALRMKHPNVETHVFCEETSDDDWAGATGCHLGRIDIDAIKRVMPRLKLDFYLCGPPPMMQAITEGLKREGLTDLNIHTESFTRGRANDEGNPDTGRHEVTFIKSDKVLWWDPEFRNLLEFAESNGVPMEAGCLFGECGACSVKLAEGEVEYHHETAIKPQPGHCLPCSCRPRSALKVDA